MQFRCRLYDCDLDNWKFDDCSFSEAEFRFEEHEPVFLKRLLKAPHLKLLNGAPLQPWEYYFSTPPTDPFSSFDDSVPLQNLDFEAEYLVLSRKNCEKNVSLERFTRLKLLRLDCELDFLTLNSKHFIGFAASSTFGF